MMLSLALTRLTAACTSDLDCSLNGVCADTSACACDNGWRGIECELLSLSPAPPGGAYGYPSTAPREPNISSWGAHVVKIASDTVHPYHMFVSELWGGCGISESWQRNSHVVHAVAATPLGPFTYVDTSLPPEATCMHMAQVPTNGSMRLVMWHQGRSGDGKGALVNCSGTSMKVHEVWRPVPQHKVHSSPSGDPAGPWVAGGAPMPPGIICNNPSGVALPNGTFAVLCHGPGLRLWLDTNMTSGVRFIMQAMGGPRPHTVWEDPSAWLDKRGHWHLLSHVYPTNTSHWSEYADIVSGHGFSIDGVKWTWHPTPPYTADVTDTSGRTRHFATRERPFLLLSDDAERRPLALYTAVTLPGHAKQNWTKDGGDYSFTHVQPVRSS